MPSKFLAETGKMYNIGKFCKKTLSKLERPAPPFVLCTKMLRKVF